MAISSLQAAASRSAEPESSGAWTDQIESQFQARLEAAVAEKTSELRGQLADAAAKLESAERKVTTFMNRCICPESRTKLWPQRHVKPNRPSPLPGND